MTADPEARSRRSPGALGLAVLLAVAVTLSLRLWIAATLPVFADEAEFARWARFPSLSYPERPPMIAWILWLSGRLVPVQALLGLRSASLLFGCASAALIWILARQLFDRRVAARALLLSLCLPALTVTGVVMVPEAPLTFFYLLFLLCLWQAFEARGRWWWIAAGGAAGLATLCKLGALLALLGTGLFLASDRDHRHWLRDRGPYLALLVTVVTISPYLIWDLYRGVGSLRYQLWERHRSSFGFELSKPVEVLLEQLANASPMLIVPLIAGLGLGTHRLRPEWRSRCRWLRMQSLTVLGFFVICGSFVETHPQWTLLAYPAAVICLSVHDVFRPKPWPLRRLRGLAAGSWLLMAVGAVVAASTPELLARSDLMAFGQRWQKKIVQAREQVSSWEDLAVRLDATLAAADGDAAVLFTYQRDAGRRISFFLPERFVVDLNTIFHLPDGRCRVPPGVLGDADLTGAAGIFFGAPPDSNPGALAAMFAAVEELPAIADQQDGLGLRGVRIFAVTGFSCVR